MSQPIFAWNPTPTTENIFERAEDRSRDQGRLQTANVGDDKKTLPFRPFDKVSESSNNVSPTDKPGVVPTGHWGGQMVDIPRAEKSKLCDVCEKIASGDMANDLDDSMQSNFHSANQTVGDMAKSAQQGCSFCVLRWNSLVSTGLWHGAFHDWTVNFSINLLSPEYRKRVDQELGSILFRYTDPSSATVPWPWEYTGGVSKHSVIRKIRLHKYQSHVNSTNTLLSDGLPYDLKPQLQDQRFYQTAQSVLESTDDHRSAYQQAKTWITTCTSSHSACKLKAQGVPASMPKRVLEIGSDDKQALRIRLHMTEDLLPEQSPYITLSHCWGGSLDCRLTAENINLFMLSIDISSLPVTFRDAIKITDQLGVKYLWIDALCIIQDGDNGKDWQSESLKMGQYYTNSYCTIAATKAKSSTDGCFAERSPQDLSQCVIDARWTKRRPTLAFHLFDEFFWYNNVGCQRLLSRGWVFQEMTLSARVLHLTHSQMFWECNHGTCCETFANGFPARIGSLQDPGGRSGFRTKRILPQEIWSQSLRLWEGMVREYTKGDLTFPEKDKLVAISGVAKRLGNGDDYYAGIWKQQLPNSLLWRPRMMRNPKGELVSACSRPAECQAPSWSWASLSGPIENLGPFEDNAEVGFERKNIWMASVERVDVHLRGTDRFGQVSSGEIVLNGPLVKASVNMSRDVGKCYPRQSEQFSGPSWKIMNGTARLVRDVGRFQDNEEVYCSPLRWQKTIFMDVWPPADIHGLLLEPVESRRGFFRRLGTFSVSRRQNGVGLAELLGALKKPSAGAHCSGRPKLDQTGLMKGMCRYDFTVV